jgi:multidrug efflux pump subunit AcrB
MSMLTSLALRGRIITILVMIAIMVGGGAALTRMQAELLPDIEFPLVAVFAPYPGNNVATVLQDITIPLESAFDGIEGLDSLSSTSSTSISVLVAEFEMGTDMEHVSSIVERNLALVTLPSAALTPRVTRVNPDEFPILQFSVLRKGDPADLYDAVMAQVLPEVMSVPGVFSAEVPPGTLAGTSVTRTNGQPSLTVSVLKDPDSNTVEVVSVVQEKLESLVETLPAGTEFITLVNQAPEIEASIKSLQREATLGAVFAVIIIFAFLFSVRPTLVIGISIPASILGGLLIMGWQGMTLNLMTLGGLAIAVGRVVDDSIVVLENVYKHIQRGGDRVVATFAATKEVAGPITVSTLTTIAVFVPLGLIDGIIGSFFLPFAYAITFALMASLLVALTVVPVLGSLFINPTSSGMAGKDTWIQRTYTPAIGWALRHKLTSIGLAVVLFVGSLGLLPLIPITFLPSSGGDLITVNLTVPRGTEQKILLEEVAVAEAVLERMRLEGAAETYQVTAGGVGSLFGPGGGREGSSNSANFLVVLNEDSDGEAVAMALREELNRGVATAQVAQAGGGGPQDNLLELRLFGDAYEAASATANLIVTKLRQMDGLVNVSTDGLAPGGGGWEDLTAVSRINGQRAVTITGSIIDPNVNQVNSQVTKIIEEIGLPRGVTLEAGGASADIDEAFKQMALAMVIGIGLVYLVMMVSMRSLITPIVIVLSLPLASIGALGALYITQRTLGLPALIGMLMLIGLVVTNAIVLVSLVEQLRAQGMSVYESLIEGGRARVRPILMTAFTTSFALVPMAVFVTEGTIIGAELATVVIGGLATSTFLTLLVIPVVYSLLRREGRRVTTRKPSGDAPKAVPTG